MSWKNIRLILHREVRDQLRDRRTLFMVVVLPLLLYPGLSVGMMQMMTLFNKQAREVVILGTDNLPELPLISDGSFDGRWFQKAETGDKLRVITDAEEGSRATHPDVSIEDRLQRLAAATKIRDLALKRNQLAEELAPWDPKLADELPGVQAAAIRAKWKNSQPPEKTKAVLAKELEYHKVREQLGEAFARSKLQVLLIIPERFGEILQQIDQGLAQQPIDTSALSQLPLIRPIVVRNRASDKSDVAYSRVREALDKWEKRLLKDRLETANFPETIVDPVSVHSIDVANEEEIAASVWSKIFPSLIVIMTLTGAFYPAIDIAAGEKERGTMETLLICPATRSEIIVGKFVTVLIFSLITTLLNLLSMGLTSLVFISVAAEQGGAGAQFDLPLPTPLALVWMLVLLLPLAAFFSALCLALATFARSNKEGQYYLTPLFMVAMGVTMFSMSPSIELNPDAQNSLFYCALPIMGPTLLLKAMLMNPNNTEVLAFGLPVLMSSVGYALIALWWAVEQFKSENVLFRADERFDLKLWLRHLLRDKEPLPTFAQASCLFILMMFLQFFSIKIFSGAFKNVAAEDVGRKLLEVLSIQQLALFAAPALFMAVLLTSKPRETLRIRGCSWQFIVAAVVLPLAMHPLAIEMLDALSPYFPQLPDSAKMAFGAISDADIPLWMIVGTFALMPAICEELAFRGFILSGFSQGKRYGVAIVLSSVTFGIIHMIPQQVFNASLLGLVLGLLAIRSRSLIPGFVFHLCFNALAVFHGQTSAAWHESAPNLEGAPGWFVKFNGQQMGYGIGTLVICGTVTFFAIRWLLQYGQPAEFNASESTSPALPIESGQVPST